MQRKIAAVSIVINNTWQLKSWSHMVDYSQYASLFLWYCHCRLVCMSCHYLVQVLVPCISLYVTISTTEYSTPYIAWATFAISFALRLFYWFHITALMLGPGKLMLYIKVGVAQYLDVKSIHYICISCQPVFQTRTLMPAFCTNCIYMPLVNVWANKDLVVNLTKLVWGLIEESPYIKRQALIVVYMHISF